MRRPNCFIKKCIQPGELPGVLTATQEIKQNKSVEERKLENLVWPYSHSEPCVPTLMS